MIDNIYKNFFFGRYSGRNIRVGILSFLAALFVMLVLPVSGAFAQSEIDLLGNGVSIASGDATPSVVDDTDFGIVNSGVGSSRTVVFTISNPGDINLILTGSPRVVRTSGSSTFNVTQQPTGTVLAGGTRNFEITFDPFAFQDGILQTAVFSIANDNTNGDANPYTFTVSGTGQAIPDIVVLGSGNVINSGDITPRTADGTDFGSVSTAVGTLSSSFLVANNNAANTLNLTGTPIVTVTGTHAADFTVTLQPSTTVITSNAPQFDVRFDPSANGLRTATISIANDDPDESPYTFAIQGTGTDPAPEIDVTGSGNTIPNGDTSPIPADGTDFGSQALASTSVAANFVISNTLGTATLTLGTVTITGANAGDFTISGIPGTSVAQGGASTTLSIQFTPLATGLRTATVTIPNNDADEAPYTFAIQGTGAASLPEIEVTGLGISIANGDATPQIADDTDFGNVAATGGVVSHTFTIENTGGALLTLGPNAVTRSGANQAEFVITSQPANTVAAGATTTFTIEFDPFNVSVHTVTVSINNDDSDENPYTFDIQGTGTGPAVNLVATSGGGQSTVVLTAFANPLVATVTDSGGNPVSGVTVSFSSTGSPRAILSALSDVTDVNGVASVTATANFAPGTYNVTASSAGLTNVTFSLTNQIGPPANIVIVAGDAQSTDISTNFAFPLIARIVDAGSNPLNGVIINFAAPGAGASAALSASSGVSDVNGEVSITATANAITGSYNVTVSSAGVADATIALTNTDPGDITAPRVTSITRQNPATEITAADSLTWRITFDEAVQNVNATDFAVAGVAGGTVTAANVSATTTDVTITGGDLAGLNGTVTLSFNPAQDITDLAPVANALSNTTPTGANNNSYNVSNAGTAPEILVEGSASLEIVDGDTSPNITDGTDFGSVAVISGSTNTSFFISNNAGTATLTLGTVTITGAGAGDFSISTAPASSVAFPGFTVLQITFAPSATGLRAATITIPNNDADENPYTFAIQGTGTAPEIDVAGNGAGIVSGDLVANTSDGTDFGNGLVGSNVSSTNFTISNQGNSPLSIGTVTVTGANPGDFNITAVPASSVNPGANTTLQITFTPTATGARSALVTIPNNDADESVYTFAVRGTATGPAANLVITSGGGQSQVVNSAFAASIIATVTDAGGNAVPGVTVNIAAPAAGASATLSSTTQVTDASGRVIINATANAIAGNYDVTFSSAGLADALAASTNTAGADTTAPRVTSIDTLFNNSPTDADEIVWRIIFDETVQNVSLDDFAVTGTTATLTVRTGPVDNPGFGTLIDLTLAGGDLPGLNGMVTLLLAGTQNITDVAGNPLVNFAPTGLDDRVNQIINVDPDIRITGDGPGSPGLGSGPEVTDGQTATSVAAGTDFGNHVVGVPSTRFQFSFANTVMFSTLVTGANALTFSGPAAADFSVVGASNRILHGNGTTGFDITFTPSTIGARNATVTLVSNDPDESPFTFNITGNGIAGAGVNLASTTGTPQSQIINTAFSIPLVATVTDAGGNPVAGVTVNFAAPGTGASAALSVTSAITNANGEASTSATANAIAGTYNVAASSTGLTDVTFALTNTSGAAATLAIVSGSPQSATLNSTFNDPLVARVTDASGNPVAGINVNFAGPGPGANAAISAASTVTDANGEVSITAIANATAGTYNITASSAGLPNINFVLTNRLGPSVEETQAVINDFMLNRATHILANQPDLLSFFDTSNTIGGGTLGKLGLEANQEGMTLAFSTSRSKILATRAQSRIEQAFASAGESQLEGATKIAAFAGDEVIGMAGSYDVWTEIYGANADAGSSDSRLWVGYLGAHYFINNDTLIGVLGQVDWADETNAALSSQASGTGWMIGPYVAGRIAGGNLSYELRAAWGRSNNDVSPDGTFTDNFTTERWLLNARLVGSHQLEALTIKPEIGLSWFEETQQAYTDSLTQAIPEQTISLGELKFGSQFITKHIVNDGTVMRPSIGVSGIWNFDVQDNNASQGFPLGDDSLRARVDAGISVTNPNGMTFKLEGYYDGVGVSDYSALGISAKLSVPLN